MPALRSSLIAVLALLSAAQRVSNAAEHPLFTDGARLLLPGDSITHAGGYVQYLDAFLATRFPERQIELVNLGLASETASGLSEPDHPFPRPVVHERLARALVLVKPDVVFACYGMNDGIYRPANAQREAAYHAGIEKLVDAVEAAGIRLILLTPPPFDAAPIRDRTRPADAEDCGWQHPYVHYDEVLGGYSQWLLQSATPARQVIDLHGPLANHLARRRKVDKDYALAADGVHPNSTGAWLITQAILAAAGTPAEADRAEIDAASGRAIAGTVRNLTVDGRALSFVWTSRVPFPFDPTWDAKLVEDENVVERFNQYRLCVRGLSGRYELFEGETQLATLTAEQLAAGIDLLPLAELSTNRQARELWTKIVERERLMSAAWLSHVGHQRPGIPAGLPLAEARRGAAILTKEIRQLAQPVVLSLRLLPSHNQ